MLTWLPAHAGIVGNESIDKLVRGKKGGPSEKINLKQLHRILQTESAEERELIIIGEWCDSSSIRHYEKFTNIEQCYGKANILEGPCDTIATCIRLGYRKVWGEKKQNKKTRGANTNIQCLA